MLLFCFRTFTTVCIAFFSVNVLMEFVVFLSNQQMKNNVSEEDGTTEILQSSFKNLGLCLIFVIQHLVMASQMYRSYVSGILGWTANLIYIVFSFICLQVLMSYWEPVVSIYVWILDTSERPLLSFFFFLLHVIAWIVVLSEHLIIYEIPRKVTDFLFWSTSKTNERRDVKEILRYLPHLGAPAFFIILWIHPCMTLDRWILATIFTWLLFVPERVDKQDYEYVKEISLTMSYSTTETKVYKK